MDPTSHPPHWPIPAPLATMSRADVAAHTAASYVRPAPRTVIEDACPDCGEPRTAGHVCTGGGTR